jgi:hypothetical protein
VGKSRQQLRHKEEKDGEVKRLKNVIRRLESDKRKLLSEKNSLEEVLKRNFNFLKGMTEDIPLEDLVKAASSNKNLKQMHKEGLDYNGKSPEEKWQCHKCDSGVLHFVPIDRHDGMFYIRVCCNKKCNNRTGLKPLKETTDKYNGK